MRSRTASRQPRSPASPGQHALQGAPEPPGDVVAGRKVASVVAAAWALFANEGFQTTSMEAIARDAGVSKATLYAYFPSKQALFAYLIKEECRKAKQFVTVPDLDQGIAEALRSFAKQYVRLFREDVPHRMTFFRILAVEAGRFPELGQLMIDSGPGADAELLAGLLEEAGNQGLLRIDNPGVAARQFLCLIRGELPLECSLGLRISSDADVDRTIKEGLRLFLAACRPKRRSKRPPKSFGAVAAAPKADITAHAPSDLASSAGKRSNV